MAQLQSTEVFGTLKIHSRLESSNTTEGALIVSGGVGISKSLNIGGSLAVSGDIKSRDKLVVTQDRKINAGAGLTVTNEGLLSSNITIQMGTPTDISADTISSSASGDTHTHKILTSTAVSINGSSINTVGVSNALARADHTHKIEGFVKTTDPKSTNEINSVVKRDGNGGFSAGTLDVAGINSTGLVKSNGTIQASSFNATSLREKKKDIIPLKDSALELLKTVEIVNFKYKNQEDDFIHTGFIADDTHPSLTGPNKDTMSIPDVLGMVIKAIQELNEKIENLEKEN